MKRMKYYTEKSLGLLGLLLFFSVFTACERKLDLDLPLAVNSNELHLKPAGGNTHIMVYSNGNWSARFKETADWVSLNKLEGFGNTDITVSYSANYDVARSVTLVLSKGNETQEILLVQEGKESAIRFSKTKYTISKQVLPIMLPVISNLKYDAKKVAITYLYDDETVEPWVSNPRLSQNSFVFDASENNLGRTRSVRVTLTLIDGFGETQTTYADIEQTQDAASLVQEREQSVFTKRAVMDTVILRGNLGNSFPYFEKNVNYLTGNGWVEDVTLANDSLLIFSLRANESGADRSATINLKLASAGVIVAELTHRVFQSAEDFEFYSFGELRGLISGLAGEILLNDPLKAIEAVVVSDMGNPNMETNPNHTYNSMDLTETYRTAYIQAPDGSYGLRVKTPAQADNVLRRYSKVSIALSGLTLVKESNPERYTLKGLTAANIIKTENGTAADLTRKTKSIAALTDSDLYTFVDLQNAEIAVPYGSYCNINMGYAMKTDWNQAGTTGPYLDAIPSVIKDDKGGSINMLVNVINPWSRNTVSRGSGTISGIVVHSKLLRYGAGDGNIGRYAIRPVDEADIALKNPAITQRIVEWNWLKNGNDASGAGSISRDAEGNVLPVLGTGKMFCTVPGISPTLGAHPVYHTDPASKTIHNSAVQYNTRWWNTIENKGEGFVFHFSTSGITGRNLTVSFTQGGGSGSATTLNVPAYWEVAYSLDGVNYTTLPNSTYCVRPLAGWGLNWNFASLGLISHSFTLPNALFNQPNVYVKLSAQQNICASNAPNGAETGRITATSNNGAVNVRVGVVSFGYTQ